MSSRSPDPKSLQKIPPPEVDYRATREILAQHFVPPHNLNKTLEAQSKEQPTLTTSLLPKSSKKVKHKHKHGLNKNCPACQKNAELAAAARAARAEEAARTANQIASTLDISSLARGGDSQSDPLEHSKKTVLAVKGWVVRNANRFMHSESGGKDQKQQQNMGSEPEISKKLKEARLATKAHVVKNANLLRDFQRDASHEIQQGYDTVKKTGLANSARVVKNATRVIGPRDQEHQPLCQSGYEDDVVEHLEGQDCRYRNRNKVIFVISFILAIVLLSGLVTVFSLASDGGDKSS